MNFIYKYMLYLVKMSIAVIALADRHSVPSHLQFDTWL